MACNNLNEWRYHYQDTLLDIYDRFRSFLLANGEEEPDFDTFVEFCYENTRKFYKHGNFLYAPIL